MNEKGYLTKIDCPGSIAVTAIKNGKTVPSTDKWMNQYKHFKLPLKTLKRRFQKKNLKRYIYLTILDTFFPYFMYTNGYQFRDERGQIKLGEEQE